MYWPVILEVARANEGVGSVTDDSGSGATRGAEVMAGPALTG